MKTYAGRATLKKEKTVNRKIYFTKQESRKMGKEISREKEKNNLKKTTKRRMFPGSQKTDPEEKRTRRKNKRK